MDVKKGIRIILVPSIINPHAIGTFLPKVSNINPKKRSNAIMKISAYAATVPVTYPI